MLNRFASRVDKLPITGIRYMHNMAMKYPDAIDLSIGQPDFTPSDNIKNVAIETIKKGNTKYADEDGVEKFRESIANRYRLDYRVNINSKQVLVTTGACEGIGITISGLVNPQDEVIMSDPSYIFYEPVVNFYGGKVRKFRLSQENDFIPDIRDIEKLITKKTKLIILNSPSNPTGSVLPASLLKNIFSLAMKNNFYIFSDEVYRKLIYSPHKHCSMLEVDSKLERTVIADSLSKTYAMTGYRIGYLILSEHAIEKFSRVHYYRSACANTIGQLAGIEALDGSQKSVEKMVKEYDNRRRFIVGSLNSIENVSCNMPQGAFYVFPKFDLKLTSKKLAMKLLDEAGVITIYGTAFGQAGEGFLRISYSNSMDRLREGINRIKKWLRK